MELAKRHQHHDQEAELKWAAIDGARPLKPVDVRQLGAAGRQGLVHVLVADDVHGDNLRLLRHQRRRMDSVGVWQPAVEVGWRAVRVDVDCQLVRSKPLPTLLNSAVSGLSLLTTMLGFNRGQERIHILKDVSSNLKPSRTKLPFCWHLLESSTKISSLSTTILARRYWRLGR